jgi:hypothetical protein
MGKECIYDVCWSGQCKKPTVEGSDFCEEHLDKQCGVRVDGERCTQQAIGDCHSYAGSFVCGTPLCEDHKKTHKH